MEESFFVSLKWELIRRVAGLAIMSNLTLPVITNDKTEGEQNFILERNVFPEPVIDKGGD